MKKNKKLTIALVAGAAVLSLGTLSACSSGTSGSKEIITMKGDTVTVSDFYNQAKEFPAQTPQQLLTNVTFNKVFEKDFGKQVTDKDVQKQVDDLKKQMGSQYEAALQQANLTTQNINDYEKTQMLVSAAIKSDIKKTQYTDANLKATWATYHPEVEAIVLSETSKDAATKAIAANKADATKFNSDNSKSQTKFDSSSTTVPAEVQAAAWKLKNGEISDVISSQNAQTGATSYYVVKMVKTSDKGTDMDKYKSKLENIIQTQKLADQSYTTGVIGKALKNANVTVKESAFSNIFSNYTGQGSSSSAATAGQ